MVLASGHEPPMALVGGRYRVGEKLGVGAAGVVWRAYDERLDRPVALKQLSIPRGLVPDEVRQRHADAEREARIAARLHHPAVVAMLDMVVDADCPWLVMQLVEGASLAVGLEEGPFAPAEAARIGAVLADALATAHAAGVVHGDVKPTNVLVQEDGRVKLADFGIASAIRNGAVTGPDEVSGTPLFMAPEVARGQRPDAASDVFSLAATVYAMVEGRTPFGPMSDDPLVVMERVARGRPRPTRLAGPLAGILDALFAVDPADRPTASAVHDLFAAEAGPDPVVERAESAEPAPVVVSLTARPATPSLAASTPAGRLVPLSVLPAASRLRPAPAGALLPRGAATSTTRIPRSTRPGKRDVRRNRRVLAPLAAAGVVAVGTIAGALSGGPGLPLIHSASDLLDRVVGTTEDPVVTPAPEGPRVEAASPSSQVFGGGVPIAAPPIVPGPDPEAIQAQGLLAAPAHSTVRQASDDDAPAAAVTTRDDDNDVSAVPGVSAATTALPAVTQPVTDTVSDTVSDGVPALVGGVTDRVPEVLGGVTDQVPQVLGGVTDRVPEVLGGVTDRVPEVLGGVTHDVPEVLGGVTHHVPQVLGGVTHGVPNVLGGLLPGGSRGDGSHRSAASRLDQPTRSLPVVGGDQGLTQTVTRPVTSLLGGVTGAHHRTTADQTDSASSQGGRHRAEDSEQDDGGSAHRSSSSILTFAGADASSGRHARGGLLGQALSGGADDNGSSPESTSSDSTSGDRTSGDSGSPSGGLSSVVSGALG